MQLAAHWPWTPTTGTETPKKSSRKHWTTICYESHHSDKRKTMEASNQSHQRQKQTISWFGRTFLFTCSFLIAALASEGASHLLAGSWTEIEYFNAALLPPLGMLGCVLIRPLRTAGTIIAMEAICCIYVLLRFRPGYYPVMYEFSYAPFLICTAVAAGIVVATLFTASEREARGGPA